MDERGIAVKAEKILLGLTAVFLLLLLTLFFRDRAALREQSLSVETDAAAAWEPVQELLDLNAASPEELAELPGIGEVLAGRIAAYREEHGPFTALEDLLEVPGIGEAKLAGLRDSVTVGGTP